MSSNPPINDCLTYLAGAGLGLTPGVNLFLSLLPDSPDQAVVLDEYPGDTDWTMSTALPAVEEYHFQLTSRDTEENYNTNQIRIQAIYRSLITVSNQTIGGTLYLWFEPVHTPTFLHRDEKRRIHHVFSFYALRQPV